MLNRTSFISSYFTVFWSAILLFLGWYFTLPTERGAFLLDPLLSLPTSLILAWLGAVAGCLTDHFLSHSMPRMFSRQASLPALLAASAIVLLLPFHAASGLLFGCILVAGRALATLAILDSAERRTMLASVDGIRGIFFVSGMAALIYQVSWQRKLIGLLGADGQSVTVIVAVFLGGLGCGALLGEKWAPRFAGKRGIALFCAIETTIGIFGIFSMNWLGWVGTLVDASAEPHKLVAAAAAALVLPTVLMGMTLPLLVETLKEKVPTIHENVGKLYALNALGSATAALFAATALFPFVSLSGATWIAALLNGLTAVLVLQASAGWPKTGIPKALEPMADVGGRFAWPLAATLALATGLVSISQEILLLRMMSWSTAARPWVFGLGVGAYLLGMGIGSQRIARIHKTTLISEMSRMWMVTAATILLLPALSAVIGGLTINFFGAPLLAATLAVLGFFGGSSLPLIAGSVRADRSGSMHFGAIYAANIVGAVIGSGLTGYILLDKFSTAECVAISATASLFLAFVFTWLARQQENRPSNLGSLGTILPAVITLLALPVSGTLYSHWREWLYEGGLSAPAFNRTIETRAGIIAVKSEPPADIVIGGGAYDGRFNTDPMLDFNLISRVYLSLALNPRPVRVLEIGLSSGSWAKVILSFPSVKTLVSVEINPGYEQLIRATPLVADILDDPRMHTVFTDGRKWLRANEEPWDAIIINASFHWREGATLLHSREFMTLAKSRLNPGGVLFINTTGAAAIAATALAVFPDVYQISNGIAAVNGPLPQISASTLVPRLMSSHEFSARYPTTSVAEVWAESHLPLRLERNHYLNCTVLTDDAMALEWEKAHCEPGP